MIKYAEHREIMTREVINSQETYKQIAQDLIENNSVIIGWTDERFDHRDILFTYNVKRYGYIQRGLRPNYLFVSIMSMSCIGFMISKEPKANGYIKEKLQLSDNSCNDKICDLINGVIHFINELEEN